MKRLALSDEILLKIDKPARYLGNEINAVMKDRNAVDVRFAMCFPCLLYTSWEVKMKVIALDENSKQNLLDELLKRSPNHYGEFTLSLIHI